MTHLLIIENGDPDRHGIDTVLMFVPNGLAPSRHRRALEEVDGILVAPVIRTDILIDDDDVEEVGSYVGEYRPFTG